MKQLQGYRTAIAGALIALFGVARFVWPDQAGSMPTDQELGDAATAIDAALVAISGIVMVVMRLLTTTPFGKRDSGGQARASGLAALVGLVLVLAMLQGCATVQPPQVRTFNESVATAASTLDGLQRTVYTLCGNAEPGAPCLETSLVTTERRDQVQKDVEKALLDLQSALMLKSAGDSTGDADDILARAERFILAPQREPDLRVSQ